MTTNMSVKRAIGIVHHTAKPIDAILTLAMSSTKAQHQMEGRLLLDVVITQSTAIFELLSSKNQSLLVWRNSLLVLNLGLDIVNRVRRLDIESDGLSRQGLDEDLEHQIERNGGSVSGFIHCKLKRHTDAVIEGPLQ
jgi:hypothetical protein